MPRKQRGTEKRLQGDCKATVRSACSCLEIAVGGLGVVGGA